MKNHTTTTAALAAVAALGLAACASDGEPGKAIADVADTVDTTAPATTTPPPTTTAPATTPPAPTLPPTTAPPAPAPAADAEYGRDDLFFEIGAFNLVGYCYSNCEPIFGDRLDYYASLVTDGFELEIILGYLSDDYPPEQWHQLDEVCTGLYTAGFDKGEEVALRNFDTFNAAMAYMTAITLVCDS